MEVWPKQMQRQETLLKDITTGIEFCNHIFLELLNWQV